MLDVEVFPLVPNAVLPEPAPARIRRDVPPGYGVQEQCLPFTAATSLGFLIPSPIAFGLCPSSDVPQDGHAFRSPLDRPRSDGAFADERVFYVKDAPSRRFVKNAFTLDTIEIQVPGRKSYIKPVQPGLSFFDRDDQNDLFKIHLPYIWRTPPDVDTLFVPAINRTKLALIVLSGLVETDWYANPVNLVLRKPPPGHSVHVVVGDPIAQVIFLSRSYPHPTLMVLISHSRKGRHLRAEMLRWYGQHTKDRSAYKKLARSHHDGV